MCGLFAVMLAALSFTGAAQARQWPSAPVKAIVNVGAGGVAGVAVRVLGGRLAEILSQALHRREPRGRIRLHRRRGGDARRARRPTRLYSPGNGMMISPHLVFELR